MTTNYKPVNPLDLLISSAKVEQNGAHATIWLWNRGGYVGSITVNADDATALLERIGLEEDEG